MKIIKNILLLAILLFSSSSFAQTKEDQTIFKAMQDEMERGMKLRIDDQDTPFWISYYYVRNKTFEVAGSLGAVMKSSETPFKSIGGVKVLLGDYKNTSDFGDALKQRVIQGFEMPMELDYNAIREKYWLHTDMAYKSAVLMQAYEKTQDTKSVSKESLAIKDLVQVPVTTKIATHDSLFTFDRKEWERKVADISSVFAEYEKLFNSRVSFTGKIEDYYMKTSEGITVKQCMQEVTLKATAFGILEDGRRFMETFVVSGKSPKDIPPVDSVKKQLRKFAENMGDYTKAQLFDKYYSGPVLFEGGGASEILSHLSQTALYAMRNPMESLKRDIPVEECLGKRITDTRLTIKNYCGLKEYKGKKLSGYYEVDADGVVPQQELVLVENGFLKSFLNDRVPKRNFEKTTGSSVYLASLGKRGYSFHFSIAPGVLHYVVSDGCKPQSMKKKLIQAAKKEGLEYAYIVRKIGGNPLVYRVDVKDGKETLESFAKLNIQNFVLRKFKVLEFSNKEIITGKMIFPSSVLVDHYEILPIIKTKAKKPALDNPLMTSENN